MAKAIWNCVILEKRQMSDYLVYFALWSDVKMYTELSVHISGSAVLLTCNYHDFRMFQLFPVIIFSACLWGTAISSQVSDFPE